MEPQNNQTSSESNLSLATEAKAVIAPLCKVTTLSKYLAAAVFIAMPFIGGFIGYSIGMQQALEMELNRPLMPMQPNTKHPLNLGAQNAGTQNPATPEVTSTDQTALTPNWMVYQPVAESKTLLYEEYVMPKDAQAQIALNSPYLTLLYKDAKIMVFTVGCFKYSECGNSGLYSFNIADKSLTTMKTSQYYSPMMTGGVWSPDKTKIAVTLPHTLGIIDVVNDTYTIAKTFDLTDKKEFRMCEMGCSSKITWTTPTSLNAEVYTYEVCNENGYDCGSMVAAPDGTKQLSSAPLSTEKIDINI